LQRKRLDLIVGNDVSAPGAGFEHDTNEVILVHADGRVQDVPLSDKREVARAVLDAVIAIRTTNQPPPTNKQGPHQ
jgi:phosphopantothenoylcysteine decarboxylase/phosphopantothenate--cysteine ligase